MWTLEAASFTAQSFDGRFAAMQLPTGGIGMRHVVLAIIMAAGVSLVGSVAASAAPANGHAISQAIAKTNQITEVRGGCGRGWHRNRWDIAVQTDAVFSCGRKFDRSPGPAVGRWRLSSLALRGGTGIKSR
jgi:hypothetical protein